MIFPFHDENPTLRTPVVTLAIIGINAAVFLGTLRLKAVDRTMLWYGRGFVPARIAQLVHGKPIQIEIREAVRQPPGPDRVRVHRIQFPPEAGPILISLLSCMFLHGGWFHLIANMWFLWLFGNNVEDRLGHVLFLSFYLAGGLLASACHWVIEPGSTTPVIGASGAVASTLGAYAITWPWARVRSLLFLFVIITIVDLPALLVLGVWFLIQLAGATNTTDLQMSGGVAWWAHVGGFLAGLVMMPLLGAMTRATGDDEPLGPIRVRRPDEDSW